MLITKRHSFKSNSVSCKQSYLNLSEIHGLVVIKICLYLSLKLKSETKTMSMSSPMNVMVQTWFHSSPLVSKCPVRVSFPSNTSSHGGFPVAFDRPSTVIFQCINKFEISHSYYFILLSWKSLNATLRYL